MFPILPKIKFAGKIFLLLVCIYTIERLLFIYTYRAQLDNLTFFDYLKILFYGTRFDISAIFMINIVFLPFYFFLDRLVRNRILHKIFFIVFLIANGVGIVLNLIDIVYYKFSNKRSDASLFNLFDRQEGSLNVWKEFVKNNWYLFLLFIVLMLPLIFMGKKLLKRKFIPAQKFTLKSVGYAGLCIIISVALGVIGIRGGFQLKPVTIISAGENVKTEAIPFVLNAPFYLVKLRETNIITQPNYMPQSKADSLFQPKQKAGNTPAIDTPANIVVIIVEGLSKEFTKLSGGKSYMPFLDSLMEHSMTMTNAYANGKVSIEGIPSITASIPSWFAADYITSIYGMNAIHSLANSLKKNGYSTSFYHGGENGTMNFTDFCRFADYDNYYGFTEYANKADYDGNWGVWDHKFLPYFSAGLDKKQQPFFATLFTLSSHHPFSIPETFKTKFGNSSNAILNAIQYVDYSLKIFFDDIKEKEWYKHTLFVITADHTGHPISSFNKSSIGDYQIPVIFFHPSEKPKGQNNTLFQQIDIYPTVLDMIGYGENFFSFGNSLYDSTRSRFALFKWQEQYNFIQGDHLLRFNGEKVTGYYNIKKDSLLQHNLYIPGTPYPEEHYLKAIIQNYSFALINNKMRN
jgi:phosphoglycerol transferase MdoB-like AlkP superfamily enzyme